MASLHRRRVVDSIVDSFVEVVRLRSGHGTTKLELQTSDLLVLRIFLECAGFYEVEVVGGRHRSTGGWAEDDKLFPYKVVDRKTRKRRNTATSWLLHKFRISRIPSCHNWQKFRELIGTCMNERMEVAQGRGRNASSHHYSVPLRRDPRTRSRRSQFARS